MHERIFFVVLFHKIGVTCNGSRVIAINSVLGGLPQRALYDWLMLLSVAITGV